MGLADDPLELWRAKDDAVKLRKDYLATYVPRLTKWLGNKYRASWKTKPRLENYSAGYMAFMLPQLVFDHPQCAVDPAADARDTSTAEAIEGMINYWVRCTRYKSRVLSPMARDLLLGWGVTFTHVDFASAAARRGQSISSEPIPIGDYFVDAHAFGYANRRFEGHSFERSTEELLADPLYDQWADVIAALPTNDQTRKREDLPDEQVTRDGKRRTVTVWQFYLPEEERIVCLAQGNADGGGGPGTVIRDEQYFGPRDGPYTMWGAFEVPGQLYPFSPLAASEEQDEDLNDYAAAVRNNYRKYKRFAVYRKGQKEDAEAVKNVKGGEMVGLTDPTGVTDMEIGGVSSQQVQVLELLKDRLDRNLGFSDAQRGVSSAKTATSENIAQNNSDLRVDWLRQALIECAEADLGKVAWFFFNDPRQVYKITVANRRTDKLETVQFYGGKQSEDELNDLAGAGLVPPTALYSADTEWTDYHLRINADSMQKIADPIKQKRAQDEMVLADAMFQRLALVYGPQMAFMMINWRRLAKRYGRSFNENDYDQILFSDMFGQGLPPDLMGMMPPAGAVGPQQAQMAGGGAGGMPGMGQGPPMGQPMMGQPMGMGSPMQGMGQPGPMGAGPAAGQAGPGGVRQGVRGWAPGQRVA